MPTWLDAAGARASSVARWLDAGSAANPGAPLAGLWAGVAPELRFCQAIRSSATRAYLVGGDRASLARAVAASPGCRLETWSATLAAVYAGHVRVDGCAAAYVPTLAAHLPPAQLAELCDVLVDWLLPAGRLLVLFPAQMPRDAVQRLRTQFAGGSHAVVSDDEGHVALAPRDRVRAAIPGTSAT